MIDYSQYKYVIVGAGFFGAVIAERIANDAGERVLVIDKRDHVGGNCYSKDDEKSGIHYHVYGTHIFHTSNKEVWDYLAQFTEFNGYRHQVLTTHKDTVYQMPINLETINTFYNVNLKPYEVEEFLAKEIAKDPIEGEPKNFEEQAITMVGRALYEAFMKGYTTKQWGTEPTALRASILKRLPFRNNYDESYFFDRWQGIPLDGYGVIFEKMLDHPNIDVMLGVDYFNIRNDIPEQITTIYSGPIDKLFDYEYGHLDWRTLRFEHEYKDVPDAQGTSVMNYADTTVEYTRIHEPKHLHPERDVSPQQTLLIKEYSEADTGENPYYPISDDANKEKAAKYLEKAKALPNVITGGRLADYKYYDMDKVIARALEVYQNEIKK